LLKLQFVILVCYIEIKKEIDVKVIHVTMCMFMAICMNVQAMEMPVGRMSVDEKFFRGIITPQQYLLSIENNTTEWGPYAAVVRALHTADYSNHHLNGQTGLPLNLYASLLNTLDFIQKTTSSSSFNLQRSIMKIKTKIYEYQGLLEDGIANGTIKEGRSGG
jgi:hypothetical protein